MYRSKNLDIQMHQIVIAFVSFCVLCVDIFLLATNVHFGKKANKGVFLAVKWRV